MQLCRGTLLLLFTNTSLFVLLTKGSLEGRYWHWSVLLYWLVICSNRTLVRTKSLWDLQNVFTLVASNTCRSSFHYTCSQWCACEYKQLSVFGQENTVLHAYIHKFSVINQLSQAGCHKNFIGHKTFSWAIKKKAKKALMKVLWLKSHHSMIDSKLMKSSRLGEN